VPQPVTGQQKIILYALLGLGFAGLIGAHELASDTIAPFVLAVLGTLCFIAAGVTARRLMK
jgi:Ca2+/Na+ antiporter